jgi:ATP-binding cassette, subfamily G (WHITE), member 2, SNQ2
MMDFPFLLLQTAVFGLILYFMTNLYVDVSKFFIYELFVYASTICITALYRMFAALSPTIDDAVRFAGTALNILIIFLGYVIPKPTLVNHKIWFGWLYYVNPVSYAFEGVLGNEFSGRLMECSPDMLVPRGPGILPQNQGCALPGSRPGGTGVTGEEYIGTTFS